MIYLVESSTPLTTPCRRRAPAAEAWALMWQLIHAHKARFFAIAGEFELAPAQAGALRSLEPGQPMPMSELASELHCDASNVTGIVDRLEARGLVERRGAAHDRRVKMLVVTDEGERVREALLSKMEQPPAGFGALTAAEQRTLRDLLRRAVGAAR